MSEAHQIAGQKGGLATFANQGHSGMSTAGRLGGRPTWQESLANAEQSNLEAVKRMQEGKEYASTPKANPASS